MADIATHETATLSKLGAAYPIEDHTYDVLVVGAGGAHHQLSLIHISEPTRPY